MPKSSHLIRTWSYTPLDSSGQAHQSQESFGISLVVRSARFHTGDFVVVQTVGALAAANGDVAFVKASFTSPVTTD